jgi:hypothetical protein
VESAQKSHPKPRVFQTNVHVNFYCVFLGGFLSEERPRANEKQKADLGGKKSQCRKLFYKTFEGENIDGFFLDYLTSNNAQNIPPPTATAAICFSAPCHTPLHEDRGWKASEQRPPPPIYFLQQRPAEHVLGESAIAVGACMCSSCFCALLAGKCLKAIKTKPKKKRGRGSDPGCLLICVADNL